MTFPVDVGDLDVITKVQYSVWVGMTESDEYYTTVTIEPSSQLLTGSLDDYMVLMESALASLAADLITMGATGVNVGRYIEAGKGEEILTLPAV